MAFTVNVHVDEIDQLQARQVSHDLVGLPPSLDLTLRCPEMGRMTVSGWPDELRALLLACLDVVDRADPDTADQPPAPAAPVAVA